MKMLRSMLAFLLAVAMLSGMNGAAFAAERDTVPTGLCLEPADGVTTEISYENGGGYLAGGAVGYAATERSQIIERIESFDVQYGGEVILTVEPRDIASTGTSREMANGYYAITFPIPNSTKECFLTGLTPQKVDHVQEILLDSYVSGRDLSIEDVDFIDAEKLVSSDDGDDNLCWAAAASNMLQYSGWGKKAGFDNEDDIFEAFIDAFTDDGGASSIGINWFFHGETAQLRNPDSGKYLLDYHLDPLMESNCRLSFAHGEDGTVAYGMSDMIGYLKAGYAVALGVTWQNASMGHAITLWGCVTDNAYDDSLLKHYDSLIISDSDSNEPDGTDRRAAPNELDLYYITETSDPDDPLRFVYATIYNSTGAIDSYDVLAPYSDAISFETDARATRDFINDPDFFVADIRVSPFEANDKMRSSRVYAGDVCLFARVANAGHYADGKIPMKIDAAVKDENGEVVWSVSDHYTYDRDADSILLTRLDELQPGVYTVDLDLDPDGELTEALRFNNHYTASFEVCYGRPDTSGIALTAEVGGFADGKVDITVDYHGVEETELYRSSSDVELRASRFIDGEWKAYDYACSLSMEGELRDSFSEWMPIQKIRYALVFYQDDLTAAVFSPEYEVAYPTVVLEPDGANPHQMIEVANDAKDLGEGNAFSFTLLNASGDTVPVINGTVELYFRPIKDDLIFLGEPIPVTLERGVPSGKITLSSWDEDIALYGRNYVMARFIGSDYEGLLLNYQLGVVVAPERGGSVVTTVGDIVDPYDEQTSLREAVAYCEANGGVVTFAPNVTEIVLNEPVSVSGEVVIDGFTRSEETACCAAVDGDRMTNLFSIAPGARLELKRLVLQMGVSAENGGAVYCDGGELVADRVYFRSNHAENGGAICFNGGRGSLSNVSFYGSEAVCGADVYIENDAEVEMRNGSSAYAVVSSGAVYNKSGRLNMINCAVAGCTLPYGAQGGFDVIVSESETNLVNCIVTDTYADGFSVFGSVKVFGSALKNADNSATVDGLSAYYANGEVIESNWLGTDPNFRFDYEKARLYPGLKPAALNGWQTRVIGGEIYLSKNGEMIPTGVETAFTDDELGLDLFGNVRDRTFYGPCCHLADTYEYLLGDANGDSEVSLTDATVIQRCDAGMRYLSEKALTAADVDRDGDVCIIDVTWIQRYDIGMKTPDGIGKHFMR